MALDEREAGRTATRAELRKELPTASRAYFDGAMANPRLAMMDLHAMTLDPAVNPQIRALSEARLAEALAVAPIGRRVAIARRASRATLRQLLHDSHPLVIAALLLNSRLVECDVLALLASPDIGAESIAVIATHPVWCDRFQVKRALLAHPRTPIRIALNVVQRMEREELELLPRQIEIPAIVDIAVERRLSVFSASGVI